MAGVAPGVVSANHNQTFQCILPGEKRLIVINALHKRLLYELKGGTEVVALLYFNNHYLPLQSVMAWFGCSYYCEVGYQKIHTCVKRITHAGDEMVSVV